MKKLSLRFGMLFICISTVLTTTAIAANNHYPLFNAWQDYGNPNFTTDSWGATSVFFNKSRLAFNAAGQAYYGILNGETPEIFKNVNGKWIQMSDAGLPNTADSLKLAINHASKTATPYIIYTSNCNQENYDICTGVGVLHWENNQWQSLSQTDLPKNIFNYPSLTVNANGTPEIYYKEPIGNTEVAKWVLKYKKQAWQAVGNEIITNQLFATIQSPVFITTVQNQPILNHSALMDKFSQKNNKWQLITSIPTTRFSSSPVVAFSDAGTPYAISGHYMSPPVVKKWDALKKTWKPVGTFENTGLMDETYLAITVAKNGEPVVAFHAYKYPNNGKIYVFKYQPQENTWIRLAAPTQKTAIYDGNFQLTHDHAGNIFAEFDVNRGYVTIRKYIGLE